MVVLTFPGNIAVFFLVSRQYHSTEVTIVILWFMDTT